MRYIALFVAVCIAWAGVLAAALARHRVKPAVMDAAFVKIETDTGHGSGVHVGRGYVLTAAHVVAGRQSITVKSETGRVRGAQLLWANDAYDVALLTVPSPADLKAAHLACRDASPGERVSSHGNPLNLEAISSWGNVARPAAKQSRWANVFIADLIVDAGMSGGAVLDAAGRLIGLVVGGAGTRTFVGQFVPNGFAFIVPGSSICHLMGGRA